ncbi:MAG TPA: hypothetical protein VEJ19_04365 [Nitrososphaerales archaeon]|nr:hypothetical protein [Nitrososphaerales archaeon]
MRSATLLACSTAACALAAALAGLSSSYGGVIAALFSLGFVLSLGSVLSGSPVRQWTLLRKDSRPGQGPVSMLVLTVKEAAHGSPISQSQIARMLRSVKPDVSKQSISKDILEPSGLRPRLKGEEYMAELEAAIKVLQDG